MNCEDAQTLIDGYLDGELDLVNHLQVEQHLEGCSDCQKASEQIESIRTALSDNSLYFRAPAGLRGRVAASLREAEPAPRSAHWWELRWVPALAATAVVAAIVITSLTFYRTRTSDEELLATEIVSSHIRSMMMNHLVDVPSSDHHTVKPWFDDKLDFSPPVVDAAAKAFPLVGGRIDYVAGRPVAALVYERRLHKINLFVFPTTDPDSGNKISSRQGYNVVHWNRLGMTFWAVSDINVGELQEFTQAIQN